MTRALGAAGLCRQLVTLNLDLIFSVELTVASDICKSLKDMPLLEHLTMKGRCISLYYCEMIHTNAPKPLVPWANHSKPSLTHFKKLKPLKIDYDQDGTCIYGPSLFATCTTALESIQIDDRFPLFVGKKEEKQLPSVKKLQIGELEMFPEDYNFVARSLPNLKWISLNIDSEEETVLDFSYLHFDYCELKTLREDPYSITLITLINNKTCHYSPPHENLVKGHLTFDNYIPSVPKESVSSPVAIKLTCEGICYR